MITLMGLGFIVFGLLSIFAQDTVWDLAKIGHQLNGHESKRTDLWALGTTIRGLIMTLSGVVMLLVSCSN